MTDADASPLLPPPGRALVTGGAGFIGSHLVEVLLAAGAEVTVVDDLSTGRESNLQSARAAGGDRLRFLRADLRDALPDLAREEPFDQIYHLAAAVGVDLVLRDPVAAIETNVGLTSEVLAFARPRRPGAPGASVLIASSSEVYGKPNTHVFSENDDVLYGPTSVSRWSYAASKAIDEYLALGYTATRGVPCVCVRFFNTVGPRQVGAYGMVLPRFVAAALRNEPIRVFGTGEQTRCFCDVRDSAPALPRLLADPAHAGRVFNLGSDRPISILGLAEAVIRTLGSRSEIVHVPYEDAYPAGFEDLRHRRPDLERVHQAIGFRPRIPLEQTIRDLAAEAEAAAPASAGRQPA